MFNYFIICLIQQIVEINFYNEEMIYILNIYYYTCIWTRIINVRIILISNLFY